MKYGLTGKLNNVNIGITGKIDRIGVMMFGESEYIVEGIGTQERSIVGLEIPNFNYHGPADPIPMRLLLMTFWKEMPMELMQFLKNSAEIVGKYNVQRIPIALASNNFPEFSDVKKDPFILNDYLRWFVRGPFGGSGIPIKFKHPWRKNKLFVGDEPSSFEIYQMGGKIKSIRTN